MYNIFNLNLKYNTDALIYHRNIMYRKIHSEKYINLSLTSCVMKLLQTGKSGSLLVTAFNLKFFIDIIWLEQFNSASFTAQKNCDQNKKINEHKKK
jgi:hypothetical protein